MVLSSHVRLLWPYHLYGVPMRVHNMRTRMEITRLDERQSSTAQCKRGDFSLDRKDRLVNDYRFRLIGKIMQETCWVLPMRLDTETGR